MPSSFSEIQRTPWRLRSRSVVPSVEPPSITRCSRLGYSCAATLSNVSVIVRTLLKEGVITEIFGSGLAIAFGLSRHRLQGRGRCQLGAFGWLSHATIDRDTQTQNAGEPEQFRIESAKDKKEYDHAHYKVGEQECIRELDSGIAETVIAIQDPQPGPNQPQKPK